MGFYGSEPFNNARAYAFSGPGEPVRTRVIVQGDAPNYTSGIELVADQQGGDVLTVRVMGWTGPLGAGTTPYVTQRTFDGLYRTVLVIGSNKREEVPVQIVPAADTENQLLQIHDAVIGQPATSA